MDAITLIDALENASLQSIVEARPSSYSGRGMYGRHCVGLRIEDEDELWNLAMHLGREGIDVPAPTTDSLGMGIIAYWRDADWPEGRPSPDDDCDDDDDE